MAFKDEVDVDVTYVKKANEYSIRPTASMTEMSSRNSSFRDAKLMHIDLLVEIRCISSEKLCMG